MAVAVRGMGGSWVRRSCDAVRWPGECDSRRGPIHGVVQRRTWHHGYAAAGWPAAVFDYRGGGCLYRRPSPIASCATARIAFAVGAAVTYAAGAVTVAAAISTATAIPFTPSAASASIASGCLATYIATATCAATRDPQHSEAGACCAE